jgi:hypothetical protein
MERRNGPAAQFGLRTGVFLGASSALVALFTIDLLSTYDFVTFPTLPPLLLVGLLWALIGPELLVFYCLPRRFPIVGRRGLSPVGIRTVLPLRGHTVRWYDVRWVGPDSIGVCPYMGTQRCKLTELQAHRLCRFLGIGVDPLPRGPTPS